MVLPRSHRVPRALCYSGYTHALFGFGYGTVTLYRSTFQKSSPTKLGQLLCPNPKDITTFGLASCNFARHYFRNRWFTFFSSGYLDVSVPQVPLIPLWIRKYDTAILTAVCCHIRKSTDNSSCATPRSLSQLVTSFFGA